MIHTDVKWPEGVNPIVEVFFDEEKYVSFHQHTAFLGITCSAFWSFAGIPFIPCCIAPFFKGCFGYKNIVDQLHCQRVGLTDTSVIIISDYHKTCCRCDCTDEGRKVKSIPLKRITDVQIQEPAGGCIVKNVLTTTQIQTAGDAAIVQPGQPAEGQLIGIKDADYFRRAIFALRDGEDLPEPSDPSAATLFRKVSKSSTTTAKSGKRKAKSSSRLASSNFTDDDGVQMRERKFASSAGEMEALLAIKDAMEQLNQTTSLMQEDLMALKAHMMKQKA